MRHRLRHPIAILAGALLLGIAVLALAVSHELRFDAPEEFLRQKGELALIEIEPEDGDTLYQEHSLLLSSTEGYRLRGWLRVPREPGPWPGVVVLGGINTGKRAARLIEPDDPHVILGLDYPWEGPTRLTTTEFLMNLFAIRRALLLTPSAALLALDYLETREDVLPSSTTFIGASFGAPLATVGAALDPRVAALVLVYGGADFERLIAANLQEVPAPLRWFAARTGARLTAPVEPLRWIGDVAPRPIVLINGLADTRIPERSVELLYEAAGEPKRLVWLDTGHISPRDERLLDRVLDAAVAALDEIQDSELAGRETGAGPGGGR